VCSSGADIGKLSFDVLSAYLFESSLELVDLASGDENCRVVKRLNDV
jgi:hypothetical protein